MTKNYGPLNSQVASIMADGDGCCHKTRLQGEGCPIGWACPYVKAAEPPDTMTDVIAATPPKRDVEEPYQLRNGTSILWTDVTRITNESPSSASTVRLDVYVVVRFKDNTVSIIPFPNGGEREYVDELHAAWTAARKRWM